jgi:hypothetical protein
LWFVIFATRALYIKVNQITHTNGNFLEKLISTILIKLQYLVQLDNIYMGHKLFLHLINEKRKFQKKLFRNP